MPVSSVRKSGNKKPEHIVGTQRRPLTVNKVNIKKYPKIPDTLDDLDKYDPLEESDAFNSKLSEIMSSTSTILRDPILDTRELPHAKNYYEWLTSRQFLGFKPYARQVDIGLQLNNDVCPKCSPEFYEEDVDFKWHNSEFRQRFVMFQYGKCPECGLTREKAVRKGWLHDRTLHIAIAGQRSSKCLVGSTLVNTPSGPVPVSTVKEGSKVRLSYGDFVVSAAKQRREYVHKIETTFGIPIEATRNHRLFTDAGYLFVGQSPQMKVNQNFLIIPKLQRIVPEKTKHDRKHRDDAIKDAAFFGTRGFDFREVWKKPYAYKQKFFSLLLARDIYQDASRFQFKAANEEAYVALRMWIEAHGVFTAPATIPVAGHDIYPFMFEVEVRKFLALGWNVISPELSKHYWKVSHQTGLPPVPGKCLSHIANLLRQVMTHHDRFKMLHRKPDAMPIKPDFRSPEIFTATAGKDTSLLDLGKPEERRELALYAVFNACNAKNAITRKRLQETLQLLRPWGNLAWTPKERKDYDTLIHCIRDMIGTRYAKITKITQSKERKCVYDITVPKEHWFVANSYHSHNSVLTGHNIGYTVHRAIHTGDPAGYYNLLPGTVLTCILTATAVNQAEKNLYRPMVNMMTMMPWFKTYAEWAKEKSNKLGMELFRVRESYTIFRASSLEIRIVAPDKRRSRGFTSLANAIDELGWFDSDSDKVMVSGSEMWTALLNSMVTVKAAAADLRHQGENDVVFPCMHAVSSPFDYSDPIMTLFNEHYHNDEALVYKYPTWRFNPQITKSFCQSINPDNYMRDFGCQPNRASGNFITKSEALEALTSDVPNAVKTLTEIYKSKSGSAYTIGKLKFRWKPQNESVVTGLAFDAGEKRNSYAYCLFHIEDISNDDELENDDDENEDVNTAEADEDDWDEDEDEFIDEDEDEALDNYRLVIDAMGEVQPDPSRPIHFTQMIKHVMLPLVDKFNVRVVLSDRWQSVQTQQDLEDECDIESIMITPKIGDFHSFREAVYDQSVILPQLEIDMRDVIDLHNPEDFKGYPVAHFIKQCMTVKELPKTVDKGMTFSDDLFRTVILAHMALRDDELRDLLLSDMDGGPEGPVSIVARADDNYVKPENRGVASAVIWPSGGKNLVSNLDDNDMDAFDEEKSKDKHPTSMAVITR